MGRNNKRKKYESHTVFEPMQKHLGAQDMFAFDDDVNFSRVAQRAPNPTTNSTAIPQASTSASSSSTPNYQVRHYEPASCTSTGSSSGPPSANASSSGPPSASTSSSRTATANARPTWNPATAENESIFSLVDKPFYDTQPFVAQESANQVIRQDVKPRSCVGTLRCVPKKKKVNLSEDIATASRRGGHYSGSEDEEKYLYGKDEEDDVSTQVKVSNDGEASSNSLTDPRQSGKINAKSSQNSLPDPRESRERSGKSSLSSLPDPRGFSSSRVAAPELPVLSYSAERRSQETKCETPEFGVINNNEKRTLAMGLISAWNKKMKHYIEQFRANDVNLRSKNEAVRMEAEDNVRELKKTIEKLQKRIDEKQKQVEDYDSIVEAKKTKSLPRPTPLSHSIVSSKDERIPLIGDVKPPSITPNRAPAALSRSRSTDCQAGVSSQKPPPAPTVKYVDHGSHWCKYCSSVFPLAAHYLVHLREKHFDVVEKLPAHLKPWYQRPEAPVQDSKENVCTAPMKGIEQMVPCNGFFCRLCKITVADETTAQTHMQSQEHNLHYKKMTLLYPNYEKELNARRMQVTSQRDELVRIKVEESLRESLEADINAQDETRENPTLPVLSNEANSLTQEHPNEGCNLQLSDSTPTSQVPIRIKQEPDDDFNWGLKIASVESLVKREPM